MQVEKDGQGVPAYDCDGQQHAYASQTVGTNGFEYGQMTMVSVVCMFSMDFGHPASVKWVPFAGRVCSDTCLSHWAGK